MHELRSARCYLHSDSTDDQLSLNMHYAQTHVHDSVNIKTHTLATHQVCVNALFYALQITFKINDVVQFARNERLHENLHCTQQHE